MLMNDIGKTLDVVCSLLGRVPGCSVQRSHLEDGQAVIDLDGERATLRALQRVFAAANAEVAPWLRESDEAPGAIAAQTIRASTAPRDEATAHGALQLAGIHLVWHLHRDGQMGAAEANGYLIAWSAAPFED